jgi:hypothetical protein
MTGMCGTEMIIGEWEIFSRLEHLNKPVEMYMMPEVDTHPSHLPQNPRQIMAIQGKTLDCSVSGSPVAKTRVPTSASSTHGGAHFASRQQLPICKAERSTKTAERASEPIVETHCRILRFARLSKRIIQLGIIIPAHGG